MGGYPACCNMGGYRKGNYRPLKAGCMAPKPKAKGKGKTPAAAPAAAPVAEPPAKKAKGAGGRPATAMTLAKSAQDNDAAPQRSIASMFGARIDLTVKPQSAFKSDIIMGKVVITTWFPDAVIWGGVLLVMPDVAPGKSETLCGSFA